MSELKAYRIKGVTLGDFHDVYIKSEADKVIAELDAEIARLNAIRKVHVEAIESMGAGLLQDDKEIRHQKYKRCLAMAKWCDAERDIFNLTPKVTKVEFFARWHKRWLEIATKFKEAK